MNREAGTCRTQRILSLCEKLREALAFYQQSKLIRPGKVPLAVGLVGGGEIGEKRAREVSPPILVFLNGSHLNPESKCNGQ